MPRDLRPELGRGACGLAQRLFVTQVGFIGAHQRADTKILPRSLETAVDAERSVDDQCGRQILLEKLECAQARKRERFDDELALDGGVLPKPTFGEVNFAVDDGVII